jgi:hypothetical protein
MADHLHKQIRSAVATKLTGLTTTSARVYTNRLQPMSEANLPGLRLYLDEEQAAGITLHQPQMQERTLTLVVEGCAKAVNGLDDVLDQISKEVEIALATGITVSGQALDVYYSGMNFDNQLADKPFGVKRMTFSIPFTAMSNAPDSLS